MKKKNLRSVSKSKKNDNDIDNDNVVNKNNFVNNKQMQRINLN